MRRNHMTFHPEYKDKTHKGKRNKRETECSVVRRQGGCGICGSENIADQGVKYCEICGAEKEYLVSTNRWGFFPKTDVKLPCKCLKTWIGANGKEHKYRAINVLGVLKCMDCGAVKSNYCQNFDRVTCWKSAIGRNLYCTICGFRNYSTG